MHIAGLFITELKTNLRSVVLNEYLTLVSKMVRLCSFLTVDYLSEKRFVHCGYQ